jgi:hypothetical protein
MTLIVVCVTDVNVVCYVDDKFIDDDDDKIDLKNMSKFRSFSDSVYVVYNLWFQCCIILW